MKQNDIKKAVVGRQRVVDQTIWQITIGKLSIRCVQIGDVYHVQGRAPSGWQAHHIGTGKDAQALWTYCVGSHAIHQALELQIAVAKRTR